MAVYTRAAEGAYIARRPHKHRSAGNKQSETTSRVGAREFAPLHNGHRHRQQTCEQRHDVAGVQRGEGAGGNTGVGQGAAQICRARDKVAKISEIQHIGHGKCSHNKGHGKGGKLPPSSQPRQRQQQEQCIGRCAKSLEHQRPRRRIGPIGQIHKDGKQRQAHGAEKAFGDIQFLHLFLYSKSIIFQAKRHAEMSLFFSLKLKAQTNFVSAASFSERFNFLRA